MNAESLIFRKLTPNEFKAITNTINSEGVTLILKNSLSQKALLMPMVLNGYST